MIQLGRLIKRAITKARKVCHPLEDELSFLYGTIFTAPAQNPDNHSRNCCVFAEGEVDRSPTGTGVSGRAAIHHLRGEWELGQQIRIESVLGTCFEVEATATTTCGSFPAVVPRVSGRAFLTGRHEFLIAPDDPLKAGFLLR